MVTVMPNSDDQLIDKNSNEDKSKDQENRIEHDVKYIETNGYDYSNLYGLLAVPFLGIVLSAFTYLLRRYQCHGVLRVINFAFNNNDVHDDEDNDSYGSRSMATPPIILYSRDFSGYNTSQTSSYASTKYSDKEIQTSLPSIDLEEKNFDSSDVESKETSIDEEDIIYLNIKEPNLAKSDKDPSFTRSGTQYKQKKKKQNKLKSLY